MTDHSYLKPLNNIAVWHKSAALRETTLDAGLSAAAEQAGHNEPGLDLALIEAGMIQDGSSVGWSLDPALIEANTDTNSDDMAYLRMSLKEPKPKGEWPTAAEVAEDRAMAEAYDNLFGGPLEAEQAAVIQGATLSLAMIEANIEAGSIQDSNSSTDQAQRLSLIEACIDEVVCQRTILELEKKLENRPVAIADGADTDARPARPSPPGAARRDRHFRR